MGSEWAVVVGTLGGALIGALGGFGGSWLLSRAESHRQIEKLAVEVGLREWESHRDAARSAGGGIAPLFSYVYVAHCHLKLIERGRLNPETIASMHRERDRLLEALEREHEGRR